MSFFSKNPVKIGYLTLLRVLIPKLLKYLGIKFFQNSLYPNALQEINRNEKRPPIFYLYVIRINKI